MSLEPFEWRVPRGLPNGAMGLAEGWSFPSAGILVAVAPLDGLAGAVEAETLDVHLEVRPGLMQVASAPILTISRDARRRNLTLEQDGRDLILRLRSEQTDRNGRRDGRPVARLADVLVPGEWVAIDVSLRPGRLTVAIDGAPMLSAMLPPAVLATWNPSFDLALGNEMTCDRPWFGEIREVVIRGPDGAVSYAGPRELERPSACWAVEHPPKLVPLVRLNRWDAVRNTVMYLPLGCLLGMMARSRGRRSFTLLVLATAGVSCAFEALQILVPSRYPSIDDVIFNTLGGALGVGLGFWLMARLATWLPEGRPAES